MKVSDERAREIRVAAEKWNTEGLLSSPLQDADAVLDLLDERQKAEARIQKLERVVEAARHIEPLEESNEDADRSQRFTDALRALDRGREAGEKMNSEWEDVTFQKSRGGGVAVLNKTWPKRMGLNIYLLQTAQHENLQIVYNQIKFTCTNGEATYNILGYVDGSLDLELAEGFVDEVTDLDRLLEQ